MVISLYKCKYTEVRCVEAVAVGRSGLGVEGGGSGLISVRGPMLFLSYIINSIFKNVTR